MDSVEASVKKLQTDSFFKFYLMDDLQKPYLVQKTVFEGVTLSKAAFEDYQDGCGSFYLSSHTTNAWKAFLFWITHRKDLPTLKRPTLVDCWMLGQQFQVPEFQDVVMIQLLESFDNSYDGVPMADDELLSRADECGWRSELGELLIEELVKSLNYYLVDRDMLGLEELREDRDFVTCFSKISSRFAKNERSFFCRFKKRDGEQTARWEDFMVRGGPNAILGRDSKGEPFFWL